MHAVFRLFSQFDLFRVPQVAAEAGDPGDIPATALITADGIPLTTADGNYLTTQA